VKTSLRFQFLIPMLVAVFATALGITFFSKWSADRSARAATLERLSSTGTLCVNATFPLSSNVLSQIEELSGLKLAILSFDPMSSQAGPDATKLEATSQGFPVELDPEFLKPMSQQARDTVRSVSPIAATGYSHAWNATALRLPSVQEATTKERYLILLESSEASTRATRQAFLLPLVTGLCSLVAISLVATLVASRIGKRIEVLKRHVEKIAGGAFESINPSGPYDAIRSLYQSVNTMSAQLQDSTAQIVLIERSRLINLIASGLAHELRNHLTGARLAIQTCKVDSQNSDALSIALKQMLLAEGSIKRLLAMRVGASTEATPSLPVDQIVRSVLELSQPIAKHQRVSLDAMETSSMELVRDGDAVIGALVNLLLNAMEAAGPSGRVELQTRITDDSKGRFVEWRVRDNGAGPAANIVNSMFEPFATTKREGVGLGLAMCRQVAQRLQGDLEWSRHQDWTEFVLRLKINMQE